MKNLGFFLLLSVLISCKSDGQTLKDNLNFFIFKFKNQPKDTSKPLLLLNYNQALTDVNLSVLSQELSSFFNLKVTSQNKKFDFSSIPSRIKGDTLQFAADEILKSLNVSFKTNTHTSKIAVVNVDLYPHNGWNFSYGKADFDTHCAVISNFRSLSQDQLSNISIHETCHTFGLEHCVNANCNMHEAKNLFETNQRGKTLCSSCKRKLNYVLGKNLMKK